MHVVIKLIEIKREVILSAPFIIFFLISITITNCNAEENYHKQIFNEVIHLIEQNYFSEINTDSLKNYYKPKIDSCSTDPTFVRIINEMLFSLNVSHIGFGKTSDIENKASPYLWSEGTIGIDIRILQNEAIVSKVYADSPADINGIKTGYRLISIDDEEVSKIINDTVLRPPNNSFNHTFLRTEEILRKIYGSINTELKLVLTDFLNNEIELKIKREERPNGIELFQGYPKIYLEADNYLIDDSIGYLSFNAFQPNDFSDVMKVVNDFTNLPNVIIDLRGNNGGSIDAFNRLASQFLKTNSFSYTLQRVDRNESYIINQSPNYYKGKTIVLVDELSISAAELFADVMQYSKSAIIVGNRTSGNVLSGELFPLERGFNLLLPVASWIREDGNILENNGVTPDINVKLNRDDLINGIDTQLQRIVDFINSKQEKL